MPIWQWWAAGVGRSGFRVGEGVVINYKGIKLANDRYFGPRSAAAGDAALYSGEGQRRPVRDSQLVEITLDQAGGLDFAEPGLGV